MERTPTDLRYGDIERALVLAFGVKDRDLGAFRARIRHLRRANVAGLPKTGTGRQIAYNVDHIRLFFTALHLNRIGMLPEVIGKLFEMMRQEMLKWFHAASERPERTYRAAFSLSTFGGEFGDGPLSVGSVAAFDDEVGRIGFKELLARNKWDERGTPYVVLNITAAEARIRDNLAQALHRPSGS